MRFVLVVFGDLDLLGLGTSAGLFRVVRIMRIARDISIFNGIRVSRFIAFVCVAKDIIANYAKFIRQGT